VLAADYVGMLRAERLVRNQILFRATNEEVRKAAAVLGDGLDRPETLFEFVCECGRRRCSTLVRLTVAEYEAVRGDAASFVVAPGHEIESIEQVVARNDRYVAVRKFHPEPIKLAVELDPRRDDA
jgi:hypothetical protein